MLKFTLLAAATAISLASVPAFAAEPASAAAAINGEGAKTEAATAQPDTKRYCIINNNTGSRIPHKECHTRKEWIAQTGVDPLTKDN